KMSIFPRAKHFELDYIIAQERAGRLQTTNQLDYHQTCDRVTCGVPREQLGMRPKVSSVIPPWWHKPPFWWYGQAYGPPLPVGDPDDYTYSKYTHYDKEPPNLREDIQVERPERYIPGQVYAQGPIDNRRPCQCPAVQVDDRNRYPVYRGPIHWPASAMEERRKYADRGAPDDEDKSCSLYPHESQAVGGSGDVPCKYYAPPSYHTESSHAKQETCICKTAHEDKHGASVTADICPHHMKDDNKKFLCPVEPGRPCPDPEGILSGKACFESSEKQRKMQLYKVGMPFRTEACRWYNQQFPAEILPPVERPNKKTFPEMRFSNL
ncbi:hypothetical protein L9F63_025291, partial [Diploptera punctata]